MGVVLTNHKRGDILIKKLYYLLQVAVVADSPEKRVAVGALSGKLNVGKMFSEPSLSESGL